MSEFTPEDALRTSLAEAIADEQSAVMHVNELLAGSYNEEGVACWWLRARSTLDGKTPQEMWTIDHMRVIILAKSIAGKN